MDKTSEFRAKWEEMLKSGDYRTINLTTHPFALSDDPGLCARCGVDTKDELGTMYSLVAFIDDENGVIRPLVIAECPTCFALPAAERDLGARIEFVSA